MKEVTIQIEVMGKPRMTRSDSWRKRPCVLRYRAYADELRLKSKNFKLLGVVEIEVHIQMPDSWSEKKKLLHDGKPHQQKPDLDNQIKGVADILCESDQHIHTIKAVKLWARSPLLILRTHP